MYNNYYGFSEAPFENNLDLNFLFLNDDNQEVLASLFYFIETKKALGVVCGDVGTGKTTLIKAFLAKLLPSVKPIMILNPFVNSLELLKYIALSLKIRPITEDILDLTRKIMESLIKAKDNGEKFILIVDEAHLLSDQSLEEIRLLSNIEIPDQKLLPILLFGQYELSHKLDHPELRHIRQRININRFLTPLNLSETINYIDYRLKKVGSSFESCFENNCKKLIFKLTKGVPRHINQLCDNSLIICMTQERGKVNRKIIKMAEEAWQTDRIFTPSSSTSKQKSRFWKYCKILIPVGAGLAVGLFGLIAIIMPSKFHSISQVIQSIAQVLPEVKTRPHQTEIKEAQTPGPKTMPVPPEEVKPPQALSPEEPQQDLKEGQEATISPFPEPKITPAPIKGVAEGAPQVKQEGVPAPLVPEGVRQEANREEIPAPGTTPKNKGRVDSGVPASFSVQAKPEGEGSGTGPLPAPPAFEQLVTRGGESLTRIAAQHYPKDPRLGIAALILQNPFVKKVDVIKPGEVLYFPKINVENRTIQLKDNLWYAYYGRYPSPERAKRIATLLNTKKINFLERDIKSGSGNTIKRLFIGGYGTENKLKEAFSLINKK